MSGFRRLTVSAKCRVRSQVIRVQSGSFIPTEDTPRQKKQAS